MTITPILFIGPVRTGKSTLAHLVAIKLNLPHVSLDDLRRKYYSEIGYKEELARQVRLQGGFLALVFYRQLFDTYAVERVLIDHPEAVIDFGAGVGPYENTQHFKRIQFIFKPIPNIFFVLPSPEIDESLQILKERDPEPPADLKFDINAHFLKHPGYQLLAKHVIYTKNKTPEKSCTEVIKLLE